MILFRERPEGSLSCKNNLRRRKSLSDRSLASISAYIDNEHWAEVAEGKSAYGDSDIRKRSARLLIVLKPVRSLSGQMSALAGEVSH